VNVTQFLNELERAGNIVRIASDAENVVCVDRGTPALLEAVDAFVWAAERRAQDAAAELGAKNSLESSGRGGVSGRDGRGNVAGTCYGSGTAGGGRWQSRGEGARGDAKPRSRINRDVEGSGVMRL
jgi:hypothetical protein